MQSFRKAPVMAKVKLTFFTCLVTWDERMSKMRVQSNADPAQLKKNFQDG